MGRRRKLCFYLREEKGPRGTVLTVCDCEEETAPGCQSWCGILGEGQWPAPDSGAWGLGVARIHMLSQRVS